MTTYDHTLKLREKETQKSSSPTKNYSATSTLFNINIYITHCCDPSTKRIKHKLPEIKINDSTQINKNETNEIENKSAYMFTASSALSQSDLSSGLPCISYKNGTNRYLKVENENELTDASKMSSFRSDNQDGYLPSIKLPPLPITASTDSSSRSNRIKSKIIKLPTNLTDEEFSNENKIDDDIVSLRTKKYRHQAKSSNSNLNAPELKDRERF